MILNNDLRDLCISEDSTFLDAIKAITLGRSKISLVINKDNKLIGILVDGDIRKSMIKGATLHDQVKSFINRNYYSVGPEINRAEVLEIMKARRLEQVPIVGPNKELLGIHLIHEILGHKKRNNKAVIMAGGKGTRLGEITKDIPKPMLTVGGRPILERLVLLLTSYGINDIYISINHLGHIIEDYFKDGREFGCKIQYLKEEHPMGSGGALSLLNETNDSPLIVLNGDLVTDINLDEMIEFHQNNQFEATLGIWKYIHQVPYGCVQITNNTITKLVEKPVLTENVNAGIYIINASAVKRIPREFFLMTDLFNQLIEEKAKVGAFQIKENWLDIGQPSQLYMARTGL